MTILHDFLQIVSETVPARRGLIFQSRAGSRLPHFPISNPLCSLQKRRCAVTAAVRTSTGATGLCVVSRPPPVAVNGGDISPPLKKYLDYARLTTERRNDEHRPQVHQLPFLNTGPRVQQQADHALLPHHRSIMERRHPVQIDEPVSNTLGVVRGRSFFEHVITHVNYCASFEQQPDDCLVSVHRRVVQRRGSVRAGTHVDAEASVQQQPDEPHVAFRGGPVQAGRVVPVRDAEFVDGPALVLRRQGEAEAAASEEERFDIAGV